MSDFEKLLDDYRNTCVRVLEKTDKREIDARAAIEAHVADIEKERDDAENRLCFYCTNPDAGDPERHEHEPQGGHWHHYIDPGDGLPSPCKNSELFERIFQSITAEVARLQLMLDQSEVGLPTLASENAQLKAQIERLEAQLGKALTDLTQSREREQKTSNGWVEAAIQWQHLQHDNVALRKALAEAPAHFHQEPHMCCAFCNEWIDIKVDPDPISTSKGIIDRYNSRMRGRE